MSNFWDNWATTHRNWKVIISVIGLLGIFIWALILKYESSSKKLLSIKHEKAVVKKIEKLDLSKVPSRFGTNEGAILYRGILELPDGTEIRVVLVPPIPQIGDRVPLLVENYDDGTTFYEIDRERWQTGEPF
jgi:hypothetical protein